VPLLTDDQLKAVNCLKAGSILVDPRYLYPRETAEERLKENCRKCWHLREYFPAWVTAYVEKWAKRE
jgi:hypothetical protein